MFEKSLFTFGACWLYPPPLPTHLVAQTIFIIGEIPFLLSTLHRWTFFPVSGNCIHLWPQSWLTWPNGHSSWLTVQYFTSLCGVHGSGEVISAVKQKSDTRWSAMTPSSEGDRRCSASSGSTESFGTSLLGTPYLRNEIGDVRLLPALPKASGGCR